MFGGEHHGGRWRECGDSRGAQGETIGSVSLQGRCSLEGLLMD